MNVHKSQLTLCSVVSHCHLIQGDISETFMIKSALVKSPGHHEEDDDDELFILLSASKAHRVEGPVIQSSKYHLAIASFTVI
ncbi:hypothetical protein GW891_03500 [bacterium]|nr:hypothetical protein [bacterium]